MGFGIQQSVEGEGEEPVSGEQGRGLIELPVIGGPSPAKVVVIHAG